MSRRANAPASPTPAGFPPHLARLADLFARLPGVGTSTANKFALWMAMQPEAVAVDLATSLAGLHTKIVVCGQCGNMAQRGEAQSFDGAVDICHICADLKRDDRLLCVVATVEHLIAMERAQVMRGRYFVLGRLLMPLEGVSAEELPLDALQARIVAAGPDAEVLLALPVSVDGEATAMMLSRMLKPSGIKVTRLAAGMAYGTDMSFADPVTLRRAMDGRVSA